MMVDGSLDIQLAANVNHLAAGDAAAPESLTTAPEHSENSPFSRLLKDLTEGSDDASETTMSLLAALLAGYARSDTATPSFKPASQPDAEEVNEAEATLSTAGQLGASGVTHQTDAPSKAGPPQHLIAEPVSDRNARLISSGLPVDRAEPTVLNARLDLAARADSFLDHSRQADQRDPQQAQQGDLARMLQAEDGQAAGTPRRSAASYADSGTLVNPSQASAPLQSLERESPAAPAPAAQEPLTVLSPDGDHASSPDKREEQSEPVPVRLNDKQADVIGEAPDERFAQALHQTPIGHGEKAAIKGTPAGTPVADLPQGPDRPQGAASVHLEVQPPELGRVRVHVALADQKVYATVITERSELHDFLLQHQRRLQLDLNTYGLDVGGFQVAVDSQEHGRSHPNWSFVYGREPGGWSASDPPDRALPQEPLIDGGSAEPFGTDRLVNLFV